jgi:segregation and condensation protein B
MPEAHEAQTPELKQIIEAALLAAGEPLSHARIAALFPEDAQPANAEISKALDALAEDCAQRGVELAQVASGYRLQVRQDLQPWVSKLWTERPQRYSRAMLETLSLIAYRQPITRGEIESVRGVSLSSNIIRTMQEREWIRVVGHRDVPGKPALFGTTREFLDHFNLKSLDDLPTLSEIRDLDSLEPELDFEPAVGTEPPGSPDEIEEEPADAADGDSRHPGQ